jgi:protein-arginine kinase activator protein McsA
MKCDNCKAYNAHVIKLNYDDEIEKHILCPRCLKILKKLNEEYESIVSADEVTSTGHISIQ